MKSSKNPNILLVVADDHRFDATYAFGNEEIKTPVLDSLVRNGVTFCNTYITGGLTEAVCAPSRACINTGNHALHASNVSELNRQLDLMSINPHLLLLPEVMRQAGYHTFA